VLTGAVRAVAVDISAGIGDRLRVAATIVDQPARGGIACSEADALLRLIPNMSHPDAPVGVDDQANLEIRRGLHEPPTFTFKARDHVELAEALELCGKPLHPYTQALFTAALPAHPDDKRERLTISGEVPSALAPPSGCRFHPRCPMAMARCAVEPPQRKEVAPRHSVACHLY